MSQVQIAHKASLDVSIELVSGREDDEESAEWLKAHLDPRPIIGGPLRWKFSFTTIRRLQPYCLAASAESDPPIIWGRRDVDEKVRRTLGSHDGRAEEARGNMIGDTLRQAPGPYKVLKRT